MISPIEVLGWVGLFVGLSLLGVYGLERACDIARKRRMQRDMVRCKRERNHIYRGGPL